MYIKSIGDFIAFFDICLNKNYFFNESSICCDWIFMIFICQCLKINEVQGQSFPTVELRIQGVLSQSVQDESVLTERRGLKKNYFVIDLWSIQMHVYVFVSILQKILALCPLWDQNAICLISFYFTAQLFFWSILSIKNPLDKFQLVFWCY